MKTLAALLAGVLLVALALAGSPRHRLVQSGRQVAVHNDAPHRNWRIGSPTSFDNLTIFPVLSEQTTSADDFITLDEGLRTGKVVITELGADGRSRRLRPQRRLDDDAEVNRLAVTNKSGKRLILIAGEMVVGGKQDRIVGHDCIIEATAKPVPIEVFCVEHGRWSGSENFGQSRRATNGGGGAAETVAVTSSANMMMAMPKVREKAQAKKSQSEVWQGVADSVQANSVETQTGDLKSVYRDKKVSHKLNDYERAFTGKLAASEVIGVVAAVNGRIISADVFANHRLFQAYWPKMMKSYALEALGQNDGEKQEIARRDAEAFLSRVEGTTETSDDPGAYRLVENQSSKDASFELESRAAGRALIHFNRVSKQ